MAPPSATNTNTNEVVDFGASSTSEDAYGKVATGVTHEPGVSTRQEAKIGGQSGIPQPPKFDDKYKEREYLKGRLALAFRIFAKNGFDEGVAGHITLRVCHPSARSQIQDTDSHRTLWIPLHSGSTPLASPGPSLRHLTLSASAPTAKSLTAAPAAFSTLPPT